MWAWWAWWLNSTSTGGWKTPLGLRPTKLRLFWVGSWVFTQFPDEFHYTLQKRNNISNEFNCFKKKQGWNCIFGSVLQFNSLEIVSPEIKQETNKNRQQKNAPKNWLVVSTNPFICECQIGSFPQVAKIIQLFELPPPRKPNFCCLSLCDIGRFASSTWGEALMPEESATTWCSKGDGMLVTNLSGSFSFWIWV